MEFRRSRRSFAIIGWSFDGDIGVEPEYLEFRRASRSLPEFNGVSQFSSELTRTSRSFPGFDGVSPNSSESKRIRWSLPEPVGVHPNLTEFPRIRLSGSQIGRSFPEAVGVSPKSSEYRRIGRSIPGNSELARESELTREFTPAKRACRPLSPPCARRTCRARVTAI